MRLVVGFQQRMDPVCIKASNLTGFEIAPSDELINYAVFVLSWMVGLLVDATG